MYPQSSAPVRVLPIDRNNEVISEVHPEDNTLRSISPSAELNNQEDFRLPYAPPFPDSDYGDFSTSPRKIGEDTTPLQKGSDATSKVQIEDNSSTPRPPASELDHQEGLEYPRLQKAP